MVEIGNVKEVIKDYIIKQLVSMGESSPAIRLLIPLAKRAITNNINSFDKFLKPIADKDGMIDIEGIFDEEMEVINLTMLNLAMFMLQLMLNIMIMLNCLKNGLVVI